MIISIGDKGLNNLLQKQLESNFLCDNQELDVVMQAIPEALSRVTTCFGQILNKYYWNDAGELVFNPFHSGQYTIFLYFLSHIVWKQGNSLLADKIYYLNKMLNACDLFYQIALPEVFFLEHPMGSVIGRATIGNYFIFQQNCTVGGNNNCYPVLGEFVWLFANAIVIGNSTIGDNVFIAAGSFVKDENIPSNTIVFGQTPHLILKHKSPEYFYSKSLFKKHKDLLDSVKR